MLSYTACRHAAMAGLDHHGDTARAERRLQRGGDLTGQPLLQLQPPGEGVDQPRQFRNADDAAVGPVGDVSLSHDRREMMLAGGDQGNRAEQHDFVIAVRVEDPIEQPGRIDRIAREPFTIGARNPRR